MTLPIIEGKDLERVLSSEVRRILDIKCELESDIKVCEIAHERSHSAGFLSFKQKFNKQLQELSSAEYKYLKLGSLLVISDLEYAAWLRSKIRWLLLRIVVYKYYLENLKGVEEGERLMEEPHTKRRKNLPEEAKEILKSWFQYHRENPYPSTEEKRNLAIQANLTYEQVNTWFINERVRNWQK